MFIGIWFVYCVAIQKRKRQTGLFSFRIVIATITKILVIWFLVTNWCNEAGIDLVLGTIPILRQQNDRVGGVRKWQFLLTFSTIYADVEWVGGSEKVCWRNIGMVPYLNTCSLAFDLYTVLAISSSIRNRTFWAAPGKTLNLSWANSKYMSWDT